MFGIDQVVDEVGGQHVTFAPPARLGDVVLSSLSCRTDCFGSSRRQANVPEGAR